VPVTITRRNGHTDTEYRDEFPVGELQAGIKCTVVHVTGGTWAIEVAEAHPTWLLTKGGARFDLEDVAEVKLFW
jgi:hypothetical protein